MNEPTVIKGEYVIVSHDCNGYTVSNRVVSDESPDATFMEKFIRKLLKKAPKQLLKKCLIENRQSSKHKP